MKINVGAGKNPLEGYVNIDRATGGEAYPLSQDGKLFESNIADEIRASHILEHFSHTETLNVLREWIRVLKPNGVLKIAVPDFDQVNVLRAKGDPLWDKYLMGGHIDENDKHGAIFTRDKLIDLMKESGCDVKYSDMFWNDNLDYCSNHPSGVSLNIQGVKREGLLEVEKPIQQKSRRIIGLMSAPRVGFTCTHGIIETIFARFGIRMITYQGAFWEQGIQNCLEQAIEEGYDDAITLDFDSVFDLVQFERMLGQWIASPHIDALAPLQPQRGSGLAMLTPMECEVSDKVNVTKVTHQDDGMEVKTAHFGLTFLRLEKLKQIPKPWFWNQPAPMELPPDLPKCYYTGEGEEVLAHLENYYGLRFLEFGKKNEHSGCWKRGGGIDADIYFWNKWRKHGNNIHVLTDVFLGHLEVLVSQHNGKTGKASYRSMGDWNEKPFGTFDADVIKKDDFKLPDNGTSAINYKITNENYFPELTHFPNDAYQQSFVQVCNTILGQPSTDLSGSKFQNVTEHHIQTPMRTPRKVYITFSGARYHDTTKLIVDNSVKLGADFVKVYDDKWLIEKHPEFISQRADIFYENLATCDGKHIANPKYTRGFGWFCWKPFIILDALKRFCDEGDIVLFSDADCYPISDLNPFYSHAQENGAMLFAATGLKQRHWCKRDTMKAMGMDSDEWRDKQAGNARYMLFKKGARIGNGKLTSEQFLTNWLNYSSQKKLTTFDLSENEYPELIEGADGKALGQHRCEQAILTNMAHYCKVPLHRPPCADGNNDLGSSTK